MSTKMERGTCRERRDGSWEACNLSGSRDRIWDRCGQPAEEIARRFTASVTVYYGGGGKHFLYPAQADYNSALRVTRSGGRPTIPGAGPF